VSSPLHDEIVARIRARGPMTVAQFMELALYDPQHGYYTSRPRRSGRQGDFFTSVDVGPLFGELIAVQLVEMWQRLKGGVFDLVEAGAGDGRLTRDILDALAYQSPSLYESIRATLIERSQSARDAQRGTLAMHSHRIADVLPDLPSSHGQRHFTGVVLANELLDALPVHVVTMSNDGPREIYVDQRRDELVEVQGPLSDPALMHRLQRSGTRLAPGRRRALSLEADQWIVRAAAALNRGFLMLIDYGFESAGSECRGQMHAMLSAYRAHTADAVHWLSDPGESDLTAHVDLSAIRFAAETAGLRSLGCVDQTYFLMALGLAERVSADIDMRSVSTRLAAKTLMLPGALGSTMKVMVFAKGVDASTLRGLSGGRLT
jgi:SAM-dependent MidA family methyltransferase